MVQALKLCFLHCNHIAILVLVQTLYCILHKLWYYYSPKIRCSKTRLLIPQHQYQDIALGCALLPSVTTAANPGEKKKQGKIVRRHEPVKTVPVYTEMIIIMTTI